LSLRFRNSALHLTNRRPPCGNALVVADCERPSIPAALFSCLIRVCSGQLPRFLCVTRSLRSSLNREARRQWKGVFVVEWTTVPICMREVAGTRQTRSLRIRLIRLLPSERPSSSRAWNPDKEPLGISSLGYGTSTRRYLIWRNADSGSGETKDKFPFRVPLLGIRRYTELAVQKREPICCSRQKICALSPADRCKREMAPD
jgi:hypothetical protein